MGMRVSPPSRENRFCPTYLVWRNFSNRLGLVESHEDAVLLPQRYGEAIADRLHPSRQPLPDIERIDVHELDANGPAIGFGERLNQVAQADRAIDAKVHRPID